MSEHYTRNTLEATAWCKRCHKPTQHRVDDGLLGPCLDPDHGKNPNIFFRVRFLSEDKTRTLKTDFQDVQPAILFYATKGKDTASIWTVTRHINSPDTEREVDLRAITYPAKNQRCEICGESKPHVCRRPP